MGKLWANPKRSPSSMAMLARAKKIRSAPLHKTKKAKKIRWSSMAMLARAKKIRWAPFHPRGGLWFVRSIATGQGLSLVSMTNIGIDLTHDYRHFESHHVILTKGRSVFYGQSWSVSLSQYNYTSISKSDCESIFLRVCFLIWAILVRRLPCSLHPYCDGSLLAAQRSENPPKNFSRGYKSVAFYCWVQTHWQLSSKWAIHGPGE